MNKWFFRLKEISQLVLIIVTMGFFIALIDPAVRSIFIDFLGKIVEVICQSGYWAQ